MAASATADSRVSIDTVQRAVNALLKWRTSKSKTQKPQLLEEDDFIYLVLTLKKIPPKARTNAHKIPLPHPLHGGNGGDDLSGFCLIIDDRPRKPSAKLTSDAAKKKIKAEDIPIAKVLKLSKLKSDYKPFEAKRKLCDSFNMFFADKRVVPLLPKLLGKQFFKKKKIPVPVDLTHKNWKEQIEKACSSALLYLTTGTCSVVRVGKASMEFGDIAENVVAAVNGAVQVVPKMWSGVRSLHLKFSESLALPIYQTLPDMNLKIEGTKPSEDGIQKEERKRNEKLDGEKRVSRKKGKGRIHEVRYMDGDELESEGKDEGVEEQNEGNCDVGSLKSEVKKGKEGDSIHDLVPSDSNGGKRPKKTNDKGGKSEESGGKKVKSKTGVGKLKIEGKHSEEGIQKEESKKDGKLDGEKGVSRKKGKGRIHEVRCMDGDELESEGKDEGVEEENEGNCDVGSLKSGVKKGKEGDSIHDLVPSDSNGGKRPKKTNAKGGKSEESGGKKVKSKTGVGKLKIEGKHSEEGIQKEESKKDGKLDGEKGVSRKKGKGRIHEVQYMDGDELESEGHEEGAEEENEDNSDVGSFRIGVGKRKEGDSIRDLVSTDSNGVKRPKKKSNVKGDKSEESGGKKVNSKSGFEKLKDGANEVVVKDKKTKKNRSAQ